MIINYFIFSILQYIYIYIFLKKTDLCGNNFNTIQKYCEL